MTWGRWEFFSIDSRVIHIILSVHHDHLLGGFVVNLLFEFTRHTHPQRERLDDCVLRDHGSGGDDGAFADHRIVQNHRAHADQAAVADRTAMQGDRMSHGDPIAHGHAVLVAHAVQHTAVLDIGVLADADGEYVAADHGVHPDARVLGDLHVADDLR